MDAELSERLDRIEGLLAELVTLARDMTTMGTLAQALQEAADAFRQAPPPPGSGEDAEDR